MRITKRAFAIQLGLRCFNSAFCASLDALGASIDSLVGELALDLALST